MSQHSDLIQRRADIDEFIHQLAQNPKAFAFSYIWFKSKSPNWRLSSILSRCNIHIIGKNNSYCIPFEITLNLFQVSFVATVISDINVVDTNQKIPIKPLAQQITIKFFVKVRKLIYDTFIINCNMNAQTFPAFLWTALFWPIGPLLVQSFTVSAARASLYLFVGKLGKEI